MSIYEPTLDLLRQALGNHIQHCHAELIQASLGWSRVFRVTLIIQEQGHFRRESIVVKTIDPTGPPTALEAQRELCFYQTLHRSLRIPKPAVYSLTTDEATGFHVIVMEDLRRTHRIPTHPHRWTPQELKSVLRAYACLHTSTMENLSYPWLASRHESLLDFEMIPEQVAIVQRAGIWSELPGLSELIAFSRQSCSRYAGAEITLLHGDTTPANAPLPIDQLQPATLIDWQDVGIGMPEFDLAYMDLQPFESGRLVPRVELLDLYWRFRAEIHPSIPSMKERAARQLHADAVTALWLTAAASRVALRPYPEGTYPHLHWSSQFGIVYRRLRTLITEVDQASL